MCMTHNNCSLNIGWINLVCVILSHTCICLSHYLKFSIPCMHCLLKNSVKQDIVLSKEVNFLSLGLFARSYPAGWSASNVGYKTEYLSMKSFPREHYMSTSHIAAFFPMALLPGLHTWNEFTLSAKLKISRRLLRGEYGKVDSPCNDTGGDICHLLLLWPFPPATHITLKNEHS